MFFKPKVSSNEARRDVDETEFVPYACHFDAHTVLSKNGELVQTIRLTGEAGQESAGPLLESRTLIRKILTEIIPSDDFAIWMHTVRRKRQEEHQTQHSNPFTSVVDEAWRARQPWGGTFVNEVYISFVLDGMASHILSHAPRSIFYTAERIAHRRGLEKNLERMNHVVDQALSILSGFGARRLGLLNLGGTVISEPLSFYGKIINLEDTNRALPVMDFSEFLPSQDVSFGFNALGVTTEETTHYAALLTVKDYHEVTTENMTRFLQQPHEFIITQLVTFVNSEEAVKEYKYQDYIAQLGGDEDFIRLSGIKEITKGAKNRPTDYGQQQLTIMLLADELEMLEAEVLEVRAALDKLGIVVVREDVMMEDLFWSQLPGNFLFVRRNRPMDTKRMAGFALIPQQAKAHALSQTARASSSILITKEGEPYPFDLALGSGRHSLVIGSKEMDKNALVNFLLAQAFPQNPRIIYFDRYRSSDVFIHALGGSYYRLGRGPEGTHTKMNPLLLPDTAETRLFLKSWFMHLLRDGNGVTPKDTPADMEPLIDKLMSAPPKNRLLDIVADAFGQAQKSYAALRFARWVGNGNYAYFFRNTADDLDIKKQVVGIDVSDITKERPILFPVLAYLMFKLMHSLDGKPTVIVIDEPWLLFDNPVFAASIPAWLDALAKRKAQVIFMTDQVDAAVKSKLSPAIAPHFSNMFLLGSVKSPQLYRDAFGISGSEALQLSTADGDKGQFLLKQGKESAIIEMNLSEFPAIMNVLHASDQGIALLHKLIKEKGAAPAAWLPHYYEEMASNT